MQVGMHEAKTNLSKLVVFAQKGEEVLITNRGEVVARIVGASNKRKNSAKELIDKMRKMTKKHPIGTLEEIIEWKNEGRE
jgi:prevent-host-death family protein